MWKRLLVGIDGSDAATSALRCALEIGKRFGAEVTGLNVVDQGLVTQPMLSSGGIYAPIDIKPLSYYSELQEMLSTKGKQALDDAAKIASGTGVNFTRNQTMGLPGEILTRAAKSYDALFIGKRGVADERKVVGKEVINVAKHCPRPVLVADDAFDPFDKVLIAYDGSPESARALRVAADLGEGGYEFHLATVSEPQRAGETTIGEARAYLDAYGIKVEYHLLSGEPAEQILFASAKFSCGMVLMGAFGHRTFLEMAFGSTTDEILRECELPVLLAK